METRTDGTTTSVDGSDTGTAFDCAATVAAPVGGSVDVIVSTSKTVDGPAAAGVEEAATIALGSSVTVVRGESVCAKATANRAERMNVVRILRECIETVCV